MIEFLFIDLDDTILDFDKAERVALEKTLRSLGLEPTDMVMSRYSQINKEHWERLERKEITREFLLVSRFAVLMEEFGIDVSPELCARTPGGCGGLKQEIQALHYQQRHFQDPGRSAGKRRHRPFLPGYFHFPGYRHQQARQGLF